MEEEVSWSGTYRTPTEEEAKKKIIELACRYSEKKWYEEKAYLLKQMKEWCEIYRIIDLSK